MKVNFYTNFLSNNFLTLIGSWKIKLNNKNICLTNIIHKYIIFLVIKIKIKEKYKKYENKKKVWKFRKSWNNAIQRKIGLCALFTYVGWVRGPTKFYFSYNFYKLKTLNIFLCFLTQ